MIFEIQIPDEIWEKYDKSKEKIEKQLLETADFEVDVKLRPYYFSNDQIAELRQHFGPNIKDAAALLNLIKKVGTIKLQEAAFQLNADQIENVVTQAYFYALDGEPRDRYEAGLTKAQHTKVIQRYMQTVLNDAMNQVLGLW